MSRVKKLYESGTLYAEDLIRLAFDVGYLFCRSEAFRNDSAYSKLAALKMKAPDLIVRLLYASNSSSHSYTAADYVADFTANLLENWHLRIFRSPSEMQLVCSDSPVWYHFAPDGGRVPELIFCPMGKDYAFVASTSHISQAGGDTLSYDDAELLNLCSFVGAKRFVAYAESMDKVLRRRIKAKRDKLGYGNHRVILRPDDKLSLARVTTRLDFDFLR